MTGQVPARTTWAVTDEGLTIYRDGKPAGTIPVASFGRLIYALAEKLRSDIPQSFTVCPGVRSDEGR